MYSYLCILTRWAIFSFLHVLYCVLHCTVCTLLRTTVTVTVTGTHRRSTQQGKVIILHILRSIGMLVVRQRGLTSLPQVHLPSVTWDYILRASPPFPSISSSSPRHPPLHLTYAYLYLLVSLSFLKVKLQKIERLPHWPAVFESWLCAASHHPGSTDREIGESRLTFSQFHETITNNYTTFIVRSSS
jgi:hypothetical protein